MAQTINTNVASLNAQRNLNTSQSSLATSLQRLSSGLRINSAKDDAAGLAISERMSAQIRGLNQASRNANDGISLAQTAEGALGEIGNNLQRIRELSVQSRNATNSQSDRDALQSEVTQLKSEIDRVANQTSFNGTNLIDGSFTSQAFQVGANQGQTINIASIADANIAALGSWTAVTEDYTASKAGTAATFGTYAGIAAGDLNINGIDIGVSASDTDSSNLLAAINAETTKTGVTATEAAGVVTLAFDSTAATAATTPPTGITVVANSAATTATGLSSSTTAGTAVTVAGKVGFESLDISTTLGADNAILAMDAALKSVNTSRADLGAIQNRFSSVIANLASSSENLSASRSRILDADFAAETANLSRTQILQQAGTAMLAQANSLPQNVLSLLQ